MFAVGCKFGSYHHGTIMSRSFVWIAGFLFVLCGADFAASQEANAKSLPPPAAALARSRSLVVELFAADLKAAATPEAHLKLAATFIKQARENRDEPANRYALLEEAQQQAVLAGDVPLALSYLDELLRDFAVDSFAIKMQFLSKAAAVVPTPEAARAIVETASPLIADALSRDQLAAAQRLGEISHLAAWKSKDAALIQNAERRQRDIKLLVDEFARLKDSIERLQADPDDAEANLDLGRYYGFLKGRWDKALPLLALGKDETLKKLARRDFDGPKSVAEQLALADDWWEHSFAEKDPAQTALQVRAVVWYERALPQLAGLNRVKASKRIDRLAAARSASANEPSETPVGVLKKLTGHTDEIKAVALSPDGRFAISGGLDQTARVWDLIAGKEAKILRGHDKQIWSVAFHPNGRWAFTGSWDGTARLWDASTGQEIRRFTHPIDVNGMALTRSGDQLLTGCDNHNACLWDIATGKEIRAFKGHTGFVYGVAISPDGKQIATSSVDKSIRLSDLATGNLIKAFDGHTSAVTAVAFTPDGRSLVSCGDNLPRLWDAATGQTIRTFNGHAGYVLCLALSVDGRRLATAGDDRIIRLWDVATGKELLKLEGHEGPVNALAMSSDGRKLVSGSLDRTVRLWGLPR